MHMMDPREEGLIGIRSMGGGGVMTWAELVGVDISDMSPRGSHLHLLGVKESASQMLIGMLRESKYESCISGGHSAIHIFCQCVGGKPGWWLQAHRWNCADESKEGATFKWPAQTHHRGFLDGVEA